MTLSSTQAHPVVSLFHRRLVAMAIPTLLIGATVAAYFPILFNGFVGLDDHATVYQNWNLTHLSASSYYEFWTTPQRDLYTPLTYSLFALISLFSRIKPKAGQTPAIPFHAEPFHAVSLVLHVLTVLVVYRLLRKLIGPVWPAAAGALLFAVHPVQVETVAWVTETNGLLCGFLSLSAILLYLNALGPISVNGDEDGKNAVQLNRSRFALATEVFILALLAKPLGVIVPVLALVLHWLVIGNRLNGRMPQPRSTWRIPWELFLWSLLASPFAIIARMSQQIPADWLIVPLWQRPLVAADALAFYIYKLFWPITLTPDYNRSPGLIFVRGWAYWTWILPALVAMGLFLARRRPSVRVLIAGAIFFVAGLIPVLGIATFAFQRLSTVADRYLYLPMFGIVLIVAWGLARVVDWSSSCRPQAARLTRSAIVLICGVTLACLGIRTSLQTRHWRDKQSLFEHSMEIIGREPGTREGQR